MRTIVILTAALLSACKDSPSIPVDSSEPVIDEDADGSPADEDCDDADAARFPGNPEICDGIDNDCDEEIDNDAVDMLTGYTDGDGDGYGDEASATQACELDSDQVEQGGDCDDSNAVINPAAPEICDANDVDEDCDGDADDADSSVDSGGFSTFYMDSDGDSYGDPETSMDSCDAATGYVSDSLDCDDTDASVYPGSGCEAPNFDGTYSGEVVINGEVPSFGISDSCVGEGRGEIDANGSPVLTGTMECEFQGFLATFLGPQSATMDGSYTSSGGNMAGQIHVQDLTSVEWTGFVNSGGRLYGEFSGSETVQGYTANFDGYFDFQLE